jgi:hypothetical protein
MAHIRSPAPNQAEGGEVCAGLGTIARSKRAAVNRHCLRAESQHQQLHDYIRGSGLSLSPCCVLQLFCEDESR